MDVQRCGVVRLRAEELGWLSELEQPGLHGGAAVAFDAVHAAEHDQQPRRVGRAIAHDVDRELLAIDAGQVEHGRLDDQATPRRGVTEAASRLGIAGREHGAGIGDVGQGAGRLGPS